MDARAGGCGGDDHTVLCLPALVSVKAGGCQMERFEGLVLGWDVVMTKMGWSPGDCLQEGAKVIPGE